MKAMYIRSETIPRQPLLLCPVGRIVALCINRILCGKVLPIMTGSPPVSTKVSASAATRSPAPLLDAKTVDKRFGDFVANDAVSFSIYPGEIHALLGENGAGKSTFVKMVYGLLQPDGGEFIWQGAPVTITGPQHARDLGIGMVFQHFSLFQALTVAENIQLALPPGESLASLSDRVRDMSNEYGLSLIHI